MGGGGHVVRLEGLLNVERIDGTDKLRTERFGGDDIEGKARVWVIRSPGAKHRRPLDGMRRVERMEISNRSIIFFCLIFIGKPRDRDSWL